MEKRTNKGGVVGVDVGREDGGSDGDTACATRKVASQNVDLRRACTLSTTSAHLESGSARGEERRGIGQLRPSLPCGHHRIGRRDELTGADPSRTASTYDQKEDGCLDECFQLMLLGFAKKERKTDSCS